MKQILVINAGSSTIKWKIVDPGTGESTYGGTIDDLRGSQDYVSAFQVLLNSLPEGIELLAAGHRVVHGGERFVSPEVVTDSLEGAIEALIPLAPLHNPANLAGIRAARAALPHLKHVAVFDTAFHHTLPDAASTLAIPRDLAGQWGLRKYGFHGTSHSFVSRAASEMLGGKRTSHRIISLHLGNGSSAAAIKGGVSIETSMGFTPLQGLVMGTRSGDLDPSVVGFLNRNADLTIAEVDALLNKESGLLGLAGTSDFRELSALAASGDSDALLALDVWGWRVRHYLGAYAALMGGLDAVVFTGGIGENSAEARMRATENLAFLGVELDDDRNVKSSSEARIISPEGSPVTLLVIPTNEEWEIARETLQAISSPR